MDNIKNVLIVEDEAPLRSLFHKRISRRGDVVDSFNNAEDALTSMKNRSYDIALIDIKLPGMNGIKLLERIKKHDNSIEVIIITGHGTIDSAIAAMKLGAYDYLTKPCKLHELEVVIQKAHEKKILQETNSKLRDEIRLKTDYGEVVGQSERFRETLNLAYKVAPTKSTVLIEGETGTGKELIANAIHCRSPRKDESFIAVHCHAIPESLLESELFGYEKGAFTGAVKQKRGLVELANQGTLFIDEVGEMNPSLQAKLLRFIENSKYRRLGGERERQIDIRIIAATNRDLFKEVKKGRFREDLYYRFKVARIVLPPLRERAEDIAPLAAYFLEKNGAKKKLSKQAVRELESYDWPGNVRELANVIEMAAIVSAGKTIAPKDLPICAPGGRSETIIPLAAVEKEHIAKALARCTGNKTKTAKTLGIGLRSLYRKIEKYGL